MGKGRGPERKVRRRLGGVALLPVAAGALDREQRGWPGPGGPGGTGGAGHAMRGAWAAPCRLLPLLWLLSQRTSPQGEFWAELVLGALPRAQP